MKDRGKHSIQAPCKRIMMHMPGVKIKRGKIKSYLISYNDIYSHVPRCSCRGRYSLITIIWRMRDSSRSIILMMDSKTMIDSERLAFDTANPYLNLEARDMKYVLIGESKTEESQAFLSSFRIVTRCAKPSLLIMWSMKAACRFLSYCFDYRPCLSQFLHYF